MIKAILDDPMLIVEGMSQQISDCYEEKGLSYCTGYTAGLAAQTVLFKTVPVGDACKASEAVESMEKAEETVEIVEGIDGARNPSTKIY